MAYKPLQLRRDTAANWTSNNPTLLAAEMGFETDTKKVKIGDGTTAWNSLGYFAAGFVDRGDAEAVDFDVDDFITDGTWRDLDLSAIIPAGEKLVLLKVAIVDDAIESWLHFRKNGSTDVYNKSAIRTQVVNLQFDADLVVGCDSNGIIEYQGRNLTFTSIWVHVKGWWS